MRMKKKTALDQYIFDHIPDNKFHTVFTVVSKINRD